MPSATRRPRVALGLAVALSVLGTGAALSQQHSALRPARPALLRRARGGGVEGGGAAPSSLLAGLGQGATRGWAILAMATVFELASGVLLKLGEGFVRPVPSIIGSLLYAASFVAFNFSLRYLEIGIAYAVWSAVVIASLAAIGSVCFGEGVSTTKTAGVVITVLGTALLSMSGAAV